MTSRMDVFERSDDREAYVNAVYYRGACALRRIASAIGAQRLDETLRRIVRERRYGTWTGRDLVAAVRDAAPNGSRIGAVLRREGLSGD
jgi:aminopeptidase N